MPLWTRVKGLGVVRGLVSDSFAVLVGFSSHLRRTQNIPKFHPIPVLHTGHGTLLAIGFIDKGRDDFALTVGTFLFYKRVIIPSILNPLPLTVLEGCFHPFDPIIVPSSPKPVRLAVLEVLLQPLLPVLVPLSHQPVLLAVFVDGFRRLLPVLMPIRCRSVLVGKNFFFRLAVASRHSGDV